jgi:hypothetical protein
MGWFSYAPSTRRRPKPEAIALSANEVETQMAFGSRHRRFLYLMLLLAFACEKPKTAPPVSEPAASVPAQASVSVAAPSAPIASVAAATATALPSLTSKPSLIPPLTDEQRKKGLDECNAADPLGLGPYAPIVKTRFGKLMIPQKGGHTPDMGFDVIVHFNGAEAARKILTQVAKGVVVLLIDRLNGGQYANATSSKDTLPVMRRAIESALETFTKNDKAHIRHLGVSAWSAGTQAIQKLLSQDPEGIDAIVIMDGLHGAWKLHAPREQKTTSLDPRFVEHEIAYMKRAQKGELLFVLTHSHINPGVYPSTYATADSILNELSLVRSQVDPGSDPYGQTSTVDVKGLHVWGYKGNDVNAHCMQLMHLARIVTEVIEPAWATPPMDRGVPPTPLPGKVAKKP